MVTSRRACSTKPSTTSSAATLAVAPPTAETFHQYLPCPFKKGSLDAAADHCQCYYYSSDCRSNLGDVNTLFRTRTVNNKRIPLLLVEELDCKNKTCGGDWWLEKTATWARSSESSILQKNISHNSNLYYCILLLLLALQEKTWKLVDCWIWTHNYSHFLPSRVWLVQAASCKL